MEGCLSRSASCVLSIILFHGGGRNPRSSSDVYIAVVHHVFLSKIQEKIDIWNRAWSQHRIRTARSLPIRKWITGQLQNPVGIELESEAMNSYGFEGFLNDNDAGDDSGDRPMFPPPTFQFSDNCKQHCSLKFHRHSQTLPLMCP